MRAFSTLRSGLYPTLPIPLVSLLAASAAADFNYPDFSTTAGISLVGSASQSSNRLRLTPNTPNLVGGAWYQTKQQVDGGFDTVFLFQLGTGTGADGFAFVLQNTAASPLSGNGCQLGYDGLANSLAVEFDTYVNGTCNGTNVNDPSTPHVSIHSLGTAPNSVSETASLGASTTVPDFANGTVHVGRITYQGGVLRVYVDNMSQPVASASLSLASLVSLDTGKAWVGFTASTGGLWEPHELISWNFVASPPSGNQPPAAPVITEPATNGLTLNPSDVHMESGTFNDPDPGDQHYCTDWELWNGNPSVRVWFAGCETGVEKMHVHLGDGVFENSHAGLSELIANNNYTLRVRHSDDSGDPNTQWSSWTIRTFHTGSASQIFPLEVEDIASAPVPRWVDASSGANVLLAPATTPPELRLDTPGGMLLLAIAANNGSSDSVTNPPTVGSHEAVRLQLKGGSQGLNLPATDLTFVDDDCTEHKLFVPAANVAANATNYYWISSEGATYVGSSGQTSPTFSTLARGLTPPWNPRQDGFKVEVVAGGFQLPVNIVFVPNAGNAPNDPFLYVSELYGKIKLVTRDRTVSDYATGLLNFNPTGAFPGSGEQGLAGIAVDPLTGDVYAGMLYEPAGNPNVHYPKIVRLTSNDGGHTVAQQTTILDMSGEPQGQSHQISNLQITPDGKLVCHMGDGFDTATAQNLNSFRGKILRLNLNGSAPSDNPFYNAANGINSADYVYCYGVRNPFGGDWRAADGMRYVVENGPSVDRFAQLVAGRNYLWDGSDGSMSSFALYNWNPARGPVNLAFVQQASFGGSGFPASKMDHAFVTESGPTYANGPQFLGKRVTEWILDASGNLVTGPIPFLEYAGTGRATACGLEAGPDGLYMTELYNDPGSNPIAPGARLLRVYYDSGADCNGNGVADSCDIASGTSADVDQNGSPDECDCAGTSYCTAKQNSLGCVPAIGASGSATLGGADDFVVTASNVLNQKTGIGLWGLAPAAAPFGGGVRCVHVPVRRLPPSSSGGSSSGSDCSGVYAQPITDAFMALQGWSAGTLVYFQFWSRDPGFAAPDNVGLTDGLRVLICP